MATEIITSLDTANQLQDQWRHLVGNHPFHSPEWNLTWFKHYGDANQLCLIVDWDTEGNLQGLAPFVWNSHGLHGRLQFLGNGLACTDYTSIFAKENSLDVIDRLMTSADQFLKEQRHRQKGLSSGRFELDGLLTSSQTTELLVRSLENQKYTVRRRSIESAYGIDLPESTSEIKAVFHRSVKRKLSRVNQRRESGELEFHHCDDPGRFPELLTQLARLHQARRKMLGQPGVFATQKFTDFIEDVAIQLGQRNQAEFQWCTMGGIVVSMHLAFLHDHTISTYISGLDPEHLESEPGFALVGSSIMDAVERGRRHFDFLRGDEPYKRLWQAQPKPLERISLTPSAVVPLLYDSAYAFASSVKYFTQSFWAH